MGWDGLGIARVRVLIAHADASFPPPNTHTHTLTHSHTHPARTRALAHRVRTLQLYEPFFADFGPLNLGLLYRFVEKLRGLLSKGQEEGCQVYYVCGADPHLRSNSAVLVGAFCVLEWGWSADEAYKLVSTAKPFVPYRDASCCASTFSLTPLDCLRAVAKARSVGLIDWPAAHGGAPSSFDIDEYEHFERVENGDLNWIVPGKFVAFSGPSARHTEFCGYRTLVPEDYIDYYHKRNVRHVVRLNKKMYDRRRFTNAGIAHHDMYFPDGTCPSEAILRRFLELADTEEGAFAVHCKAGLGRTGVLICSWMMKEWRFTANEAIAYIRICRPGSVIGPQQHFLRQMEERLWAFGDAQRAAAARREYASSVASSRSSSSRSSGSRSSARGSSSTHAEALRPTAESGELEGVPAPVRSVTPKANACHSSPLKPLRTGTRPLEYAHTGCEWPTRRDRHAPVSRTLATDTLQNMHRPRVGREGRQPLRRTIDSSGALRSSSDPQGLVPGTPEGDATRHGVGGATLAARGLPGSRRSEGSGLRRTSNAGLSGVTGNATNEKGNLPNIRRESASGRAAPLRSLIVVDNYGNCRPADPGDKAPYRSTANASGVQRIVTASGQPRKVPAATLRAGGAYANAYTPQQASAIAAATAQMARTNLLGDGESMCIAGGRVGSTSCSTSFSPWSSRR